MNQQDIILKRTFHEEMIALYKRIVKELKYKSPRLLEMINKYGGYEAAIKILPTDAHTFDFTLLWEQQRLDLSVEALVTKDTYKQLFPQDVVKLCQRRLDEYNYAPNHIEEVVEEVITPYVEEAPLTKEDFLNLLPEEAVANEPLQIEDYVVHPIPSSDWADLFMKTSIFTAKNQDLILKMYSLGSLHITSESLSDLEGYSSKYPFYEVILSLCKRIKAALKIEVPKNEEGKLLWWQLLFTGSYESNQRFCFNLRPELDQALTMLMEEKLLPTLERALTPEYEALNIKYMMRPSEESTPKRSILSPTGELPSLDDFIDFLIDDTPAKLKVEPTTTVKPVTPIVPISPSTPIPLPVMAFHSEALNEKEEATVNTEHVIQTESTVQDAPIMQQTSQDQVTSEPIIQDDVCVTADTPVSLFEEKKAECLNYYGAVCELCGFDFGYTYGLDFEGLIKIHNLKPLEPLENLDPHQDLIPICHNCEAVLHARTPHYAIEDVKTFIAKAQDAD
ncbi:MAG: hypothetical protein RR090_08925 [Niameybacter sp.]|uniref:HNH endonuclease n=1 Tax=Niameybacter sp. TaxID=2033640 RepID=UPI002FC72C32